MSLSSFLASFLGLYLIVMGLLLLLRGDMLQKIVLGYAKNREMIIFSGALALIGGLLITLSHNVWELSWRVVVTLLGYLLIVQGVLRLFYPEWVSEISKKANTKEYYLYMGAFFTLLGLFLAYHGFQGTLHH